MPYGAYGVNSYLSPLTSYLLLLTSYFLLLTSHLSPFTAPDHIPNRPRDDILADVVLRDTVREWDRVLLLLP